MGIQLSLKNASEILFVSMKIVALQQMELVCPTQKVPVKVAGSPCGELAEL